MRLFIFTAFSSIGLLVRALSAEAPQARMDERHRAFFKDYCVECHNINKQKGKLRLDDVSFALDSIENADRWQKILNQINSGEMPPEDAKQPEKLAKTDFLDSLSSTLVTARKSLGDAQGKITMRRLNRREYKNTIRDLLGIDLRVNVLPADGGAGTFDTVGSSLFMSSDQFDQYLALGRYALDESFLRTRAVGGDSVVFRLEVEGKANQEMENRVKKSEEGHEKFTRWQIEVDKAAAAPENQEVVAKLHEEDPRLKTAKHLLYYQADRLKGAPKSQDFGLGDAPNAAFGNELRINYSNYYRHYLTLPHRQQGAYLMVSEGYDRIDVNPTKLLLPGNYVMRLRVGAVDGTPADRHFIQIGHRDSDSSEVGFGSILSTHQITGSVANPQVLEIPLQVTAETAQGFSIRERQPSAGDPRLFFWAEKSKNGYGPDPTIWVDYVELEGPVQGSAPALAATPAAAYRLEPETVANPELEKLLNQYETTHQRFVRWQEGVDKAAAAPENQATLAELKKKDPRLNHPESTWLYSHADEFQGAPKSNDFGLGDTANAAFVNQRYGNVAPYLRNYLALPARNQGAYLTLTEGYVRIDIEPPSPLAPGRYLLRMRAGVVEGTPAERQFIEIGIPDEGRIKWNLNSVTSSHQITGTVSQPEILEVPVEVHASTPLQLSIRERQPGNYETAKAYYFAEKRKNGYGPDPAIWIDWIELERPVSKADQKSAVGPVIFANTTGASERDHARAIIEKFATRAFRGQEPSAAFIEKLAVLYDKRRHAGDSFEVALKAPLSVVLASPGFLYLQEPGEEIKPRSLTDLEFATRLSYFLWSAPPDDTLLALAKNNTLHQPDVLAREVDRMISDAKSSEFVTGFVHQWLGMERLDFFQFDNKQFRDFDESAKVAARREVYETFGHLLRRNGSLTRLLKSDEIFVNGLLATYYGIEGVRGDEFRSVKLPADSPRGGLLGMAAVLAMGSNGQSSSPVERGAWVLRKLLHDPPPPAPPNVPQLTRLEGKLLTTRDRIAAHQEEPQCAQCHRKIDPIGFGLENFNAVGKWRTKETYVKPGVGQKTWPIDPAGALYNGPAFKDYFELRNLIAAKPQQFAHGFTEALIEYALGRPFGFLDQDLANDIVKHAEGRDFAVSEFVQALASSKAFQSK
jgi:hypothetical protein